MKGFIGIIITIGLLMNQKALALDYVIAEDYKENYKEEYKEEMERCIPYKAYKDSGNFRWGILIPMGSINNNIDYGTLINSLRTNTELNNNQLNAIRNSLNTFQSNSNHKYPHLWLELYGNIFDKDSTITVGVDIAKPWWVRCVPPTQSFSSLNLNNNKNNNNKNNNNKDSSIEEGCIPYRVYRSRFNETKWAIWVEDFNNVYLSMFNSIDELSNDEKRYILKSIREGNRVFKWALFIKEEGLPVRLEMSASKPLWVPCSEY